MKRFVVREGLTKRAVVLIERFEAPRQRGQSTFLRLLQDLHILEVETPIVAQVKPHGEHRVVPVVVPVVSQQDGSWVLRNAAIC
jgi:hypothetical protein